MTVKQRLLHMILFEGIALLLFVPLAVIITQEKAVTMTGLSIGLSLIAMIWNFIYNWGFDLLCPFERINRGISLRICHAIGFELGMVATSFPILMLVLQKDFLTILWMDIGAVSFFFIYAILFNWAFDVIQHRLLTKPQILS